MEAIRLPPRLTTVFVGAAVFEADDWPDRHAPAAVSAARIAIADAAVTKRSRHPNCLVKTCPVGQELGRSKLSVQRQREVAIFRAIGRQSQDSYNNSQFSGFGSGEFMLELQERFPKQLYTPQPLNDSGCGPGHLWHSACA
jgi:hypothetical protein